MNHLNEKVVKLKDKNSFLYILSNPLSINNSDKLINCDQLYVLMDDSRLFQNGILYDNDLILHFSDYLRRGFIYPNSYNLRLINYIKDFKRKFPRVIISFLLYYDKISLLSEYSMCFEEDYAWGPQMPKNLINLECGVTKYNSSETELKLNKILFTDFWWKKKDNSNIFELQIEDVFCDKLLIDGFYPTRYVHLQFDLDKTKVIHFDLSIRLYDFENYNLRVSVNDISKINKKSSKRIKLIKFDGVIEEKDAFNIICLFYYNNKDVLNYFENKS